MSRPSCGVTSSRPNHVHRRRVLEAAAAAVALAAWGTARGADPAWPIGCFNRAWAKWPSSTALAAVRAAGYRYVGFLSNHEDNPLVAPAATAESLETLKRQIAAQELTPVLSALRFSEDAVDEELERVILQQLDHSRSLGVEFVMTFGVDQPRNYARFLRLMSRAAQWAAERQLKLVLKPHGGISGDAEQLQRCIDAVAHPNFSLWYDAGNIVHYTGKDPVAELKSIVRHVTGFCAKDCVGRGGEVMIQFGTGAVSFRRVLGVLNDSGFRGPVMVEGLQVGPTADATTEFARANRAYLENVLRQL